MTSTRITSFVICLSLACLMLTGNALAGTTTAKELTYATEVGVANTVYTIPAGNTIVRVMAVLRQAASGNFFFRVTLGSNSEFATGSFPVAGDLTQTAGVPGSNVTITLPTAVADGDTFVEWSVIVNADFTGFPTFTVDTATWTIKDVDNVLGGGGTIQATIITRDANTGDAVDGGTDADDWLKSAVGVKIAVTLSATTAVVDVATARKKFVATSPDATDQDNGATVGIDGSVSGVLAAGGTAYTLVAGDKVELVITGTLTGITTITWDVGGVATVKSVSAAEVTAGSTTLTITGSDLSSLDASANSIRITVDGSTALSERTLQLTIKLVLSGGAGGPVATTELQGATNLTIWTLNGTVLIANFQNGNNGLFASRMYLFNSSTSAGNVTARVWTLPKSGGTPGVEKLLGTVAIGSIGAGAGRNIHLDTEILANIVTITLPYTDDGGNLVVEITIEAPDVTGVGQVYNATTLASFGIFPMVTP